MSLDLDELQSATLQLAQMGALGVLDSDELAAQFRVQTLFRHLLLCMPNERIKPDEVPNYLRRVLGQPPSEALIDLVRRYRRGPRLSEADYIGIENRQNSRCALCGALLIRSANPHVDHVIPVAYGGESTLSNYQILCSRCNQGKKAAIHWVMASPYFSDRAEVSNRLSYCVLSRHQGKCAISDCSNCSRDGEMHVAQIIASQDGGRPIFDNLHVLCRNHNDDRIKHLQTVARAAVVRSSFPTRTAFTFR